MGQGGPGALCAQGALRGQLKLQWMWVVAVAGLSRQKAPCGIAEAEVGKVRVSQNAQCREYPGRGLELGQHGLGVPGAEPGDPEGPSTLCARGVLGSI